MILWMKSFIFFMEQFVLIVDISSMLILIHRYLGLNPCTSDMKVIFFWQSRNIDNDSTA